MAAVFVDILEAGAAYEGATVMGVEMAETATVEGEIFYATEEGLEAVNIGEFTSQQEAAHAQLQSWGISGGMQTSAARGARGILDNKLQMLLLQSGEIGALHQIGGFHALKQGTLGQNQLARPFGLIPGAPKRPGPPVGGDPKRPPRGPGGGGNPKRPGGGPGAPKRPKGGGGGHPKRPGGGDGGGGGRPPPPHTPKKPEGGQHHRAPWAPGDEHDVFGATKTKSKSEESDSASMPRNPTGIAKTTTRTHRFCTNHGKMFLGLNNANNDSYVVKANSIVEPVGADAGARNTPDGDTNHDAMLFNQFNAIYQLFTVRRSRIRVDFSNADHSGDTAAALGSDGTVVGIAILDSSANLVTAGHYQELADTKWRGLGPEQVATMTHAVDIGKFFGVPKVMSDDTLRMSATAGTGDIVDNVPPQPLFWHIFFHSSRKEGPLDAEGIIIDLTITVDYDVTWSEPKAVAQS